MYNEPNLHSRNLKLLSVLFICYWVLGLNPTDESIRLLVINYEISNPAALKWISHILLVYFAWRFYISSRRQIRNGYRKNFNFRNFDKRSGWLFEKLKKDASSHYQNNLKAAFEAERKELSQKHEVQGFSNDEYSINPNKLIYDPSNVTMHYQVQYGGSRVPGNDFKNGAVVYPWYSWIGLKTARFVAFLFSKEEAPDYLVPWVLFSLAVTTSVLTYFCVTVHDVG